MKKAEAEKIFINHLKEIGIKTYYRIYERGNSYWCFELENGTTRYWTNLSDENAKALGLEIY